MPHKPSSTGWRALAAAVAVSSVLVVPIGVRAEENHPLDDTTRAVEEAIQGLLDVMSVFLESLPQYAAPEVLDNGDIIIRRIHPEEQPPPGAPDTDRT